MIKGSFGGNQSMGGGSGGGGGGGGWMFRRVASAVSRTGGFGGRRRGGRATVHKEQSPTSPRKLNSPKIISLSSPTSSSSTSSSNPFSNTNNLPLAAPSPGWPASFSSPTSSICDEFEWINEDERFIEHHGALLDDFIFGSVPSQDEVQSAVASLQQVFNPGSFPQMVWDKYGTIPVKDDANHTLNSTGLIEGVHSFRSELDWIEPSMNLYNSRIMQPRGPRTLYDAFNLLQSESSIQRMVVSLSSDKAVWNAVLNNEVVQELRESLSAESESNIIPTEGETPDSTAATSVLMWILDSTTAKAKELIEMIVDLANHLFQPGKPEKTAAGAMNSFEEKLRSSLLLTVVVLLVVVIARVQRA